MEFSVLMLFALFSSVSQIQAIEQDEISDLKSILMTLVAKRAAELAGTPPKTARAATLDEVNKAKGERHLPVYNDGLIGSYRQKYSNLVDQLQSKETRNNILRSAPDGTTFVSSSTVESTTPYTTTSGGGTFESSSTGESTTVHSTTPGHENSERVLSDHELFTMYKYLIRELRLYADRRHLLKNADSDDASSSSTTTDIQSTTTDTQSTTTDGTSTTTDTQSTTTDTQSTTTDGQSTTTDTQSTTTDGQSTTTDTQSTTTDSQSTTTDTQSTTEGDDDAVALRAITDTQSSTTTGYQSTTVESISTMYSTTSHYLKHKLRRFFVKGWLNLMPAEEP